MENRFNFKYASNDAEKIVKEYKLSTENRKKIIIHLHEINFYLMILKDSHNPDLHTIIKIYREFEKYVQTFVNSNPDDIDLGLLNKKLEQMKIGEGVEDVDNIQASMENIITTLSSFIDDYKYKTDQTGVYVLPDFSYEIDFNSSINAFESGDFEILSYTDELNSFSPAEYEAIIFATTDSEAEEITEDNKKNQVSVEEAVEKFFVTFNAITSKLNQMIEPVYKRQLIIKNRNYENLFYLTKLYFMLQSFLLFTNKYNISDKNLTSQQITEIIKIKSSFDQLMDSCDLLANTLHIYSRESFKENMVIVETLLYHIEKVRDSGVI